MVEGFPGEEYTLLSTDYFKNYNGIKVKVRDVVDTPMEVDDSLTCPVVYIDLGHLRRLFALPEGRGFPFLLSPHRASHALSIRDSLDMARIRAAAAPGVEAYTVSTVSVNLNKSYLLYRGLLVILCSILVIVLMAAISANLAINFQNRRADFGLMKAFGCSDSRLLGFVLSENALGLGLPFLLAIILNIAFGLAVKPFKVLYNFNISPRAGIVGFAVILAASIVLWLASSIQPYRYLKRIDPVDIMREE